MICQAWRLKLAAWCLLLQAFKKLLAAAQVAGRQCAMVLSEPWQQIIMFNSLHVVSSPSSPDQPSPAEGSPPGRLLFFLSLHHS